MAPAEKTQRYLALSTMAMALVLAWQALTVHVNYAGNWSALFCTGALRGVPATLASEHIWVFPASSGYDGQLYHYIAHDPLMRNKALIASVDDPRLRYRRILVPGLAYILAAGQADWVDPAYYLLILVFVGAGVWWTAGCCRDLGRSPAWGLLFLLLPATLVSIDRMVTDVALAAFAAGFAHHARAPSWKLFLILAAAALTRETGFLLLAGYCGYLLLERRWKQTAIFSLAATPAVAWYAYVHAHTLPDHYTISFIPLSAIWTCLLHPLVYPPGFRMVGLAKAGDYLALGGILAAFALGLRWGICRKPGPVSLSMLCFVAMGLILQKTDHWLHVYDYGRVYSPMLLFLAMNGLRRQSWAAALPFALILPRIAMQFGGQILGIVAGTKLL
jgi:hypothetical protein